MQRHLLNNLIEWANSEEHLPLILRGARQVGKTYLIEDFAKVQFKQLISINFELQPQFKACFKSLQPQSILREISALTQKKIFPQESLLFFDEIQNCPEAIQSLRYFKEQLPEYYVIAAGSLLEFALKEAQFSMPVGRVTFRYLYPLSFNEFLQAEQAEVLCDYFKETSLKNPLPESIHATALEKLKNYFYVGGMPAVVTRYIKQANWLEIAEYQGNLLQTYQADFAKYSTQAQRKYLERLFERLPYLLGQRFKYSHVDPDLLARDLKIALTLLIDAGVIMPSYACHASGIPLAAGKYEKLFKLFFLDIGLVQQAMGIMPTLSNSIDFIQMNQGPLAEQFVAQEFMAYAPCFSKTQLYFWERDKIGSMAEVDFVIQQNNRIIPIEVKAGKTGRLKSLRVFMQEKSSSCGIRISTLPLNYKDGILTIPFYLIAELPRLLNEVPCQQ